MHLRPVVYTTGFFLFCKDKSLTMTEHKRTKYTLIAIMMLLLFNYPLIGTANKVLFIGSIPVLYIYLSIVWLVAIALLYITVVTKKNVSKENDE